MANGTDNAGNEKMPPASQAFGEKRGFRNVPRSNRIIWILMIAGIGSFIFISYHLLDTSSLGGVGSGGIVDNDPEISSAEGVYSNAYEDFVRRIKENRSEPERAGELPAGWRTAPARAPAASQQTAPRPAQRQRTESFLASVPKNVKVVQKQPSKEYLQSQALLASALTANSEVKLDASSGIRLSGMGDGASRSLLAALPGDMSSAVTDAISSAFPSSLPSQTNGDGNSSAMAHQDRNDAFIQKSRAQAEGNVDQEYVASTRRAPRGKYELMAGSLISGILMGGINSDTPGTVLGQISENVYDSATGSHLLIPQGARMVGTYDSHVVYGQNRLVVVWQRILYPDGTSLNLGGMIGGDQAGNAGFKQYVDNHYSRLIGAALLASVFTAAGKIATDNDKDEEGNESKAAEAVMETMSQLGAKLAERNMNVSPTLRIKPGYRFSVVTTKDIAFAEPYRE